MAVERGAMTNNVDPAGSAAVSSPETNGAGGSPSCYRISVISGSLEVSARFKNVDDLELLLKVLEANKALFVKSDPVATDLVVKVTKTSSKVDRSETEACAKADGSGTNAKPIDPDLDAFKGSGDASQKLTIGSLLGAVLRFCRGSVGFGRRSFHFLRKA